MCALSDYDCVFVISLSIVGSATTRMCAQWAIRTCGGIGHDGNKKLTGWQWMELTCHLLSLPKKLYGRKCAF